jgi:polysaccharide biosynthesis transport protein
MRELSPYLIEPNGSNGLPHPSRIGLNSYSDSAGIGITDCLKVIRDRWRLIAGLVGGAVFITALIVFTMTPRYVATATLMIDPEPPHLMDVASLLERMQTHDDDDYAKTQFALLQSDQVVATVIRDLNLETNPAFHHSSWLDWLKAEILPRRTGTPKDRLGVSTAAIENYMSHFRVAPDNGTRLVKVSFDASDPELAAQIVNAHVQAYLAVNREIQGQSGDALLAFLQNELVRIKGQIQRSEAALNKYRDRTGILTFGEKDQEHNDVAQQNMEDLQKALTDAEDERIKAQSEMQQVSSGDYESLPDVVNNLLIQNLRPQVDQLQAQYAELSAKYYPAYPPLAEVRAKLAEARRRLNLDMEAIARATKRRYFAAAQREAEVQRKVNDERHRDFQRNDASLQDAVLARDVESNREIYAAVLKRMQEVGVNGAAPVSNIGLVENAIAPPLPSIPQKTRSLALAALSSTLLGIALAFLFDQFDDGFKSVDEIHNYLNQPELGVLPDFARLPGKHRELPIDDGLSLMCFPLNGHDRANHDQRLRAIEMLESFKSIRTALLYSRAGGAPKTLLFASALPGEGKTMTAAGTALAFAQTGARTLLIDADLRRPRCHSIFDSDNSAGLSEVLVGRADWETAVQRLDRWPDRHYAGLYLLSAGGAVPNPGELLTSMKMFELCRDVSNEFDFVMIDSSPVLSASDTLGLATMVDGVVVVASVDTPKPSARYMCRRLANAGAKILGVVMNRVDIRRKSFSHLNRHYLSYKSYEESARHAGEVAV